MKSNLNLNLIIKSTKINDINNLETDQEHDIKFKVKSICKGIIVQGDSYNDQRPCI